MAKGKNLNPADAYRKSLRKKELKKNKADRSKAREFALVKKDTRELEGDIQKLESAADLTPSTQAQLANLKSELEKINKKKAEYVEEHPEHRKLVYRSRHTNEEKQEEMIPQSRNVFKKNGLPRHPERSIYYDPQMNPFGVPPPGMPYMERPLRPDEIDSEEEDIDDDDIAMPEGPPPGIEGNEEAVDSDDDIPMPEGPPPNAISISPSSQPPPNNIPVPSETSDLVPNSPGTPSSIPPLPANRSEDANSPRPNILVANNFLAYPAGSIPPLPPPPGFSAGQMMPPVFNQHTFPNFSQAHLPPPPPGFSFRPMPPPPPGFYPHRQQTTSSMQDPLSSIPHRTFQAHRDARSAQSLGIPNVLPSQQPSDATISAATLSAEPQLRDLKREATAFVPTSVKRKKTGKTNAPSSSSKINAAPSLNTGIDPVDSQVIDPGPSRPDLLNALKEQFGPIPAASTVKTKKDDYEKFVEEMGDILGPGI